MSDLTVGLSTYADECVDASHALDARRRLHEKRHPRYGIEARPAPRAEMMGFVNAIGPTELASDPSLVHAPVRVTPSGPAFAPERMTINCLIEVYERLHGVKRPDGKVYDRVRTVLETDPTGLRLQDIVMAVGASRTACQNAVKTLEWEGIIVAKSEKTRGTARKRYYPRDLELETAVSLSPLLEGEVI